jgi:uncharacterized coiled-coil DUF342 family protein
MNLPIIPISFGELFDKYTILQIKQEKIKDNIKLKYIQNEINYLSPFINTALTIHGNKIIHIIEKLKQINECLWNIEDNIREKEKENDFNQEFIELARSVYKTNDQRNKIKCEIDAILNCELCDVKSYTNI